ncbi:hypothetical protein [Micromonospora sp. MW-13]|uniref:hypothetical protein n=1 Tax=Micromonospora sp. MW-13 TaxID=2094022 RepID=UPI000FFF0784|nr:hypothetical protein [Micromonospora sp. MW-13]
MTYYAVFRADEKGEAAGLLLMDIDSGDALVWNNRLQEWTYDPALAARFLDDHRNFGRYQEVEAAEARRIAERITGGSLPGEADVVNLFRQGNLRERPG